MAKFSKEQWVGIALILAAIFMLVPIPLIEEKIISAIIVTVIGLWKLLVR